MVTMQSVFSQEKVLNPTNWNNFHKYVRNGKSSDLVAIQLTNLPSPIYLRRGTQDINIFKSLLMKSMIFFQLVSRSTQ